MGIIRFSRKGPSVAFFSGTVGSAYLLGASFLNSVLTTIGAFLSPFIPVIIILGNVLLDIQHVVPIVGQLFGNVGTIIPNVGTIIPTGPAVTTGFFWTG